jgi:hypothetical protein
MSQPNPPQFQVGDEIEFEKSDGWRWIVAILGRAEHGKFDCMIFDGQTPTPYAGICCADRSERIPEADGARPLQEAR